MHNPYFDDTIYKTKNVEFDYNHTSSYGLTDKSSLCHCTKNEPV